MKRILSVVLFLALSFVVYAQKANIAAAANLRYVLEEIKTQYVKENPKDALQITYGASGTLTQQILNGAPIDLFLSADTVFPKKIKEKGLASGDVETYCYGKTVMWSASMDVSQGLAVLLSPAVKKIAIANPATAPYGENTVAMLKKQKLYDKVSRKIVWGENINQTAQFAFSGNAEIGFIALSLALAPEMKNRGNYYVLPENICPPVKQAAILVKGWEKNGKAFAFLKYLTSAKCKSVWEKYGYKVD